MSSKLTTIYDNLGTLVAGVLTGYRQIPNPYIVDENNDLYLTKGFGIAVGGGVGIYAEMGPHRQRQREMTVTLIRKVVQTEHDTTGRQTLEKTIIEDMLAVETALEIDNTLSGSCIKADYSSDTGIQFLANEAGKYINIDVVFTILYQETLT